MRNHNEFTLQQHLAHYLDGLGILWTSSMAGGINLGPKIGRLKKMAGCKPGVPDILIFEVRPPYSGLFIELKSGTKPTPKQIWWHTELNKRGYKAVIMPKDMTDFSTAFDYVRKIVDEYIGGKYTAL